MCEQKTLLSRLIIAVLMAVFIFLMSKRVEILQCGKDKWLIPGIVFIMLCGILKSFMIDTAYDTFNYHLIAQELGFINYFTQHYGLGNFQAWGFKLSDRLFYPFRAVLGLRMGAVFNGIVLSISYCQLSRILKSLSIHSENDKYESIYRNIYALIILLGKDSLFTLGGYYVDIIGFPLGLEIVRLILKASDEEINCDEIIYFAVLNGFWFALKMTNIVYCIPAVLIFIFLVKRISLRNYIISGLWCILPCSVYLAYNYMCTRNPVFPYFNKIFHSPFFLLMNFKDYRWGGESIFEKMFWIFYAVLQPEYRQSEINYTGTGLYIIGLLAICVYVAIYIINLLKKHKINAVPIELIIFVLSSAVLWGFTAGYSRYYAFGMVMLAVIGYHMIDEISHTPGFLDYRWGILLVFLFVFTGLFGRWFYGMEWSYSPIKSENIRSNWEYVLSDRTFESDFDSSIVNAFAISDSYYGGIANLISDGKRFCFNLAYLNLVPEDEKNNANKILNDIMYQGNVYDIRGADLELESYRNSIKIYGLDVKTIKKCKSNMGEYYLIELISMS